jgi:hypothetical protein
VVVAVVRDVWPYQIATQVFGGVNHVPFCEGARLRRQAEADRRNDYGEPSCIDF